MTRLWLDTETYSETPIRVGTYRYAASAEVMLFAWALDNGPAQVWDLTSGEPMPEELAEALDDDSNLECWAHNTMFDRTVLRHQGDRLSAVRRVAQQIRLWRDTMVQALAHGLPGSLGDLCDILNVPTDKAKDKAGKQLVQLFCKPRPAGAKIRRATRETHPAEWARFVEYARLDIDSRRAVHAGLPLWNYKGAALALWHLDQRINDRGVAIDLDLAEAAVAAVAQAQAGLSRRTQELTDGAVQATTQRDQMLAHVLEAYGVSLPDMQMATIERRVADPDLPAALRELLAIRLQASSTSTAKYQTLMKGTSTDGRLRGLLQFDGAARTGRWAGRLFQPQNLPRPTLKQDEIDQGIEAMKAGCADLVTDDVMRLTSSAIRGAIVAPKGKKIVVADLSNIEGRDQAWLAGERWKLRAFSEFDAGKGPDLYKLAYSKSFGVKPEAVDKEQRQVGKVQELALGYEGGVGAFVTFAAAYGIDLDDLALRAKPPTHLVDEARDFLAWTLKQKRSTFGLSEDAFVICDALKRGWREAHPEISTGWKELAEATRQAIHCPGNTMTWRKCKVRRDGSWLRIGLPSGRALCYPSPQVSPEGQISYMGVDQYTRRWSRLKTYGGKLFENICQGVARDVMAANMPAIEAAGYEITLTVHDEVITEAPDSDEFNADHLSSLLAAVPAWAEGMPLAAAGFETYRYKKD